MSLYSATNVLKAGVQVLGKANTKIKGNLKTFSADQ